MLRSSPEFSSEMSDGARWLTMCGRSDAIDKSCTLRDGRKITGQDFPSVSEEGAKMMFVLEKIGPHHPLYQQFMPQAQDFITKYFGPPPEQQ